MVRRRFAIFYPRHRSLVRGMILSLGAFFASLRLAGFPSLRNLHSSHWQIACLLVAAWGMFDVARCLQRKWSLYHAGILLTLYSDLMILTMILFLVFYP
jgi:hypothetical protein